MGDKNKYSTRFFGFSLIEILIAIALFAILSVIAVQSLGTSLKSSRKSEATGKARENVDYAISTMERLLRNAKLPVCSGDHKRLDYTDEYGNPASFTCNGTGNYIASGSARLTSPDVVVDCDDSTAYPFSCPPVAAGVPEVIVITVKAEDANAAGAEGAIVTSRTRVNIRNYTLD